MTFHHSRLFNLSQVNKECKMLNLVVEHLNLLRALLVVNMIKNVKIFDRIIRSTYY